MISAILRDKVMDFVHKNISVKELEEWLVPKLPSIISDPFSDDADLVSAIELGMTELNAGIRSYDDFITYLQGIVQNNAVRYVDYPSTSSSSSSSTQRAQSLHSSSIITIDNTSQHEVHLLP